MKFTKSAIQGHSALIHYLIGNQLGEGHKVENGTLVNIYDKTKCIKYMKLKIKKHSKDARYKKFVPHLERHIKILEKLK